MQSHPPSGSGLQRYETVVQPQWVDYNSHMSDFWYGHLFGEAMDVVYRGVGIDDAYRKSGRMFYTVESHAKHSGEAKVNEPLYVTTQVIAVDDKRLHVFHRVHRGRDNEVIATGEQMHLHVDTAAVRATAMDPALKAKLEAVRKAHAALSVPQEIGKPVGSRAKR